MMTPHATMQHDEAMDTAGHEAAAGHGDHGDHGGHAEEGHGEHGHGEHGHGDHVAMFRRRFWWSLLLTVPMVVTSHMVMGWFGYELDFPGMSWIGPVLG